ncbi:MAG: hypothetical protein M1499_06480 [Firmicutes bacterium]|nr:hypothetical protein [Bacillota bacterium]
MAVGYPATTYRQEYHGKNHRTKAMVRTHRLPPISRNALLWQNCRSQADPLL